MALPKIIFFDLGKVLLDYDFTVAARRLNALTGLDGLAIMNATLAEKTPVCEAIETDQISSEDLYQWVRENFGMTISRDAYDKAHRDIFTVGPDSLELVKDLKAAGLRLGVLSNICQVHWDFCLENYPEVFGLFDLPLASVLLKARKPNREIYERAAQRAGVGLNEIVFFDDRTENVQAACDLGIDGILFTDAHQARLDLQKRGIL